MPDETEALFGGADYGRREAGRDGIAGGGADPPYGHFRADVLSLEEAIRGSGGRPGAAVAVTPGIERAAKEGGSGANPGPSHAPGRTTKKLVKPLRRHRW